MRTSAAMEPWELAARESVRDVIARYNSNGDSGRFDQVMELFAPDAVMDVDGRIHRGRDEIRTIFTGAAANLQQWEGPKYLRHLTSTTQIDVLSPTEATARSYYQVLMPHGLDHWGRYLDTFGIHDGRWVFTLRREILDGWVPGAWAQKYVDSRDD